MRVILTYANISTALSASSPILKSYDPVTKILTIKLIEPPRSDAAKSKRALDERTPPSIWYTYPPDPPACKSNASIFVIVRLPLWASCPSTNWLWFPPTNMLYLTKPE